MRKFLKLIYVCFGFITANTYAQTSCPDATNISNNQFVCGLYGDANGNSNWNWEIRPDDPSGKYCEHWYARINNATNLTAMRSPFVDPQTSALELIVQQEDYKKTKGWELLRRNFGCQGQVGYPYFILYNKYTGLMRVFIYQPVPPTPQYSSFLVELTPVKSAYPATTSLGDAILTAPDKYQTSTSSSTFGRKIISVTEDAGSSNWRVAEFNLGFDPNIQDGNYLGSGISLVMYGLVNSTVKAKIRGGSVSGSDPKIYSFSYSPDNPVPTPNGENFDFKTQGEKFTKFSKTLDGMGADINKAAKSIVNSLSNVTNEKSLKGRIKGLAEGLSKVTETTGSLTKLLNQVGAISGIAGSALSFIGGVVGLFGGGDDVPGALPIYTSYDLTLDGTITAKTTGQSIVLRIPGAQQPGPDNLPYYRCPVGIFNIKNTPQAEKITYERAYAYKDWYPSGPPPANYMRIPTLANFVSYRMSNDIQVSFNSGAGLDLVSVQAAIVGEVQKGGDGNAAYDLLMDHGTNLLGPFPDYRNYHSYNFMLPDFQAGILQMTTFEPEHNLHTFQTPYVNIECLNGLAFNARAETNVFLRVKAILKKKNDPANTPIYYIRDYAIDATEVEMDGGLRSDLRRWNSYEYPTPFTNYSELPMYIAPDRLFNNNHFTGYSEERADNTITAESNVFIAANADVTFKAGYEVELNDGFEAENGSNFEATLKINQSNLTCGTLQAQAYNYGQGCYNTNVSALRVETKPAVNETVSQESLKVYPIPTSGKLFIEGVKASNKTTITILDQSGRLIKELRPASFDGGRIDVDVSSLSNGVYFVKIQTLEQIITRKIVVTK
ncbi:T9SS type A sorting domain-containing protein [Niastella sp. OAS944]|uniref:T9SS type A sorting domain-containing protein n=1 Tax=Niastella sp. OAS944 TaxID=2664089 RepID=UPI00346DB1BE|nr:hypothetical protein [Chitinophagaceae bacterium OAS944]